MNPQKGSNVATVVSVGWQSRREQPSAHQHGDTGGGSLPPICFQLRWLSGYFIIVSMIYSQSIWFHLCRHTCNTQVGGVVWRITLNDAHLRAPRHKIKPHVRGMSVWEFSAETNLFHRDTDHYVCHPIIRSLGASGAHRGSNSIFRTVRLNQSLQDSLNMPDLSCDLREMSQLFLFLFFCFTSPIPSFCCSWVLGLSRCDVNIQSTWVALMTQVSGVSQKCREVMAIGLAGFI